MIEVFKHEESGYGDILSREFTQWRSRDVANAATDSKAKKPVTSDADIKQSS